MREVKGRPPNYHRIVATFPSVREMKGVVFTYGDVIFNPDGVHLDPWLKAHEGVHYTRQSTLEVKIMEWWDKYLTDAEFRFAEELPAHRAEYQAFRFRNRRGSLQHEFLSFLASRLASPMYGSLCTASEAARRIAA